jgi:hypothetical protein
MVGDRNTSAFSEDVDDLLKRGLRKPEFLIVDGGTGLEQGHGGAKQGAAALFLDGTQTVPDELLVNLKIPAPSIEIDVPYDAFAVAQTPTLFPATQVLGLVARRKPHSRGSRRALGRPAVLKAMLKTAGGGVGRRKGGGTTPCT